jgi:hypothetical protein
MYSPEDVAAWCDEHLPALYDEGMFDYEESAEEVWEGFEQIADDTVLSFVDDAADHDEMYDQLHDAAVGWFRAHHDLMIAAVPPVSEETLAAFQTKPQVDQHSAEWYSQRRNRLTASEFWQILSGSRGALLRSKVDPAFSHDRATQAVVAVAQPDGEMQATCWGHRFESVVRRIYEEEIAGTGTVCDTLGRFTHHTVPWLSASPDGVVLRGPLAGRLVEIKAPKTRQPGALVPDDYYVQMQVQMEVCDLDAVDFVEAQFAQRPTFHYSLAATGQQPTLSDEDAAKIATATWKGRIEVYGHLDDIESWTYRYTAPVNDLEDAAWLTPAPADLPLLESSVWWLTGWFPRTVLRNRTWWRAIGWPEAQMFWMEVETSRLTTIPESENEEDPATIQHVGGWLGR